MTEVLANTSVEIIVLKVFWTKKFVRADPISRWNEKIYPNRSRRGSTSCSKYWPYIHDFLPHIGDTVFVWRSLPGTDSHTDTLKHTEIDTGKSGKRGRVWPAKPAAPRLKYKYPVTHHIHTTACTTIYHLSSPSLLIRKKGKTPETPKQRILKSVSQILHFI